MSTAPLNPLVEKVRSAHPGAYDDMDDAALTKAVLAKYPQYVDMAAPPISSVPKPNISVLPHDLLGSVDPNSFTSRVGERIQQNVNMIPHAIDSVTMGKGIEAKLKAGQPLDDYEQQLHDEYSGSKAAVQKMAGQDHPTTLGKVLGAATIAPRMAIEQVKGYIHDPATAVGDLITAAPELSEMRGIPDKQWKLSAPPTEGLPLSPEQQAAADYTKAQGEAWKDYTGKAKVYHDKMSEAFDTAKRDQQEADVAHQQSVQDIQDKHAAATAKAQASFAEASAKEAAARQEHEQRVQAARESREQAAAVDTRRQEITQAQQAMAEDTRQQAQALYQGGRKNLDTQWDQVRQQVGSETPTPIEGVVNAMNKAESEYLRGSPGSVQKFRQLANELGLGDMFGVQGEGDVATSPAGKFYAVNPEQPTAPWQTVRTHASNIGRAMASGDLGNVYPAMKLVRDALEKAAGNVAEARGAGEAYRTVRASESQFRKDFEDLGPVSLGKGNPAARLVRAPNANFASDIIHGKASDLLEQALARWDKTGQLPTNIQQMRGLADELKNLPKVKVLPEPAPYAGQAPTMPQVPAPELPTKPGIPEKTHVPVGQAPELAHVERPVPAPVKTKGGFIRNKVLPKLGGAAAASANLPLPGHTFVNYTIGKEATTAALNRLSRPPSPTAASHLRTILDAKDGLYSPGEADRRIIKTGGRVKIKPLPQEQD